MTDVSVTLWPPCLCPSEGHNHGVSIQSAINLGDTLLQITREWKTAETWFLAGLFIYQSSIVSQTLDFFIEWIRFLFWLHDWWKPRIRRRIQNGKALFRTKSTACFSLLKMLKYVRVLVAAKMLTNTCYWMSASFTDKTGVTSCTQKFIHNTRSKIEWDRIFNTEHAANFEPRESELNVNIPVQ